MLLGFLSQESRRGRGKEGEVVMQEEVREKFEDVNTAGLKIEERIWPEGCGWPLEAEKGKEVRGFSPVASKVQLV